MRAAPDSVTLVLEKGEIRFRRFRAGPGFDPALSFRDAKSRATGEWEKQYFTALMHRCEFNLPRAAREARMDRTHLRELLLRYQILRE